MKLCPRMGLNINLYDKEKTAKTTAHIRKISIALFFINIRPLTKAQRDTKSHKEEN